MATIRGASDEAIDAIASALEPFEQSHADAEIAIYRQNSVSVRIRILDPDFAGIDKADRHEMIWQCFDRLADDVQSQVTLLLLLTPDESAESFANFEFDHPVPSRF